MCDPLSAPKLQVTVNDPPDELIALDEALIKLAEQQPEKAKLVNLRYFGGLTHEEAAQALGISLSTADRHWAYARVALPADRLATEPLWPMGDQVIARFLPSLKPHQGDFTQFLVS
jgi:hypothetical protein